MADDLQAMLGSPDSGIDLVRGALLIARREYPDLDLDACEARLAELAGRARGRLAATAPGSRAALEGLCQFLFTEEGFQGNDADYYDPRNSFLNEVLDRRLGIPITLALVAGELGTRVGLDTFGIGFPGRFLMGCHPADEGELVVVDCHEGRIVDHRDCQRILREIYEGALEFDPELLQPASPRQVLARILANLVNIYVRQRDVPRALAFADLAVATEPRAAHVYRNRGLLHYEAEDYRRAIADLEECLRLMPPEVEAPILQHHLERARARLASWN